MRIDGIQRRGAGYDGAVVSANGVVG